MEQNLLDLTARELLTKIGKGKHVPGSGSVAAFDGLLSCHLLSTVLSLTLRDDTIRRYRDSEDKCKEILLEIETTIRPELETLFQRDSVEFDELMQSRIERRDALFQNEKNSLTSIILNQQVISTETPLLIAKHCVTLAEFGIFLFENAYSAVRGDSGVAISNSLTGLYGSINIIHLNLVDFPKNGWTEKIYKEVDKLTKKHDALREKHIQLVESLKNEALSKNELKAEFKKLKLEAKSITLNSKDIEIFVRKIQNGLWNHKATIWPKNPNFDEIEILSAQKTLRLFDYAFKKEGSLGTIDNISEVGGICNNKTSTVHISEQFSLPVINFTTAHELGHALFHDSSIIHRDIPLDGSDLDRKKPEVERQADKFAAFFLMPRNIVKRLFFDKFKVNKFIINDVNANALDSCTAYDLLNKYPSKRDLSIKLASTKTFDLFHSFSMAERFNVSVTAMAIQLEEFDLV